MNATRHTVRRMNYLHFYNAPKFGLVIARKTLATKEENFLTFVIGSDQNEEYVSLVIGRKEALAALKKFRKNLVKSRQKS